MTKTWRRGWITCDAVVRVAVRVAVVSVSVVFEGWGKVGRNKHGLMCKCKCLNKNPVLLLRDKTENLSQETSPHSQEIQSHEIHIDLQTRPRSQICGIMNPWPE